MRIDYLTFTVFGFEDTGIGSFWDEFTGGKLGKLVAQNFGGRGFRIIHFAMEGAKLYSVPIQASKQGNYFSIELSGKACSCLTPDDFQKLYFMKQGGVNIRITRIDYAYDNVPFTPEDFYNSCMQEQIITVSSRGSIMYINSPYQKRENGDLGCSTAYLGSASSDRRVRVYNLHGYTRLELQLRAEWANTLAWLLLAVDYKRWVDVSKTHLLDFVRVKAEWWDEFISELVPALIKIYSSRTVTIQKVQNWLGRQVVPALFAYQSVVGIDEFLRFVVKTIADNPGRLDKYRSLMEMGMPDEIYIPEQEVNEAIF